MADKIVNAKCEETKSEEGTEIQEGARAMQVLGIKECGRTGYVETCSVVATSRLLLRAVRIACASGMRLLKILQHSL